MFACSLVWYRTSLSITGWGIWLDAALSRKTSGFPFTSSLRIGKSARTRSTSKAPGCFSTALWMAVIAISLSQRRAGLRHHRAFQARHDRRHRYAVDHRGAKRISQEVAGHVVRESPAPQVKKLLRIDLPDGGTVSALDVVRENFELGLGIHGRFVGQEQVAAFLGRIRKLRAPPHE